MNDIKVDIKLAFVFKSSIANFDFGCLCLLLKGVPEWF